MAVRSLRHVLTWPSLASGVCHHPAWSIGRPQEAVSGPEQAHGPEGAGSTPVLSRTDPARAGQPMDAPPQHF